MKTLCVGIPSPFDLANPPPIDLRRISILLIARHHTALAANTFGHVEVEAILLARQERALWNTQLGIKCSVVRAGAALVYVRIQHENSTAFSRFLDEGQWHRGLGSLLNQIFECKIPSIVADK
jgi:hypothetical protein